MQIWGVPLPAMYPGSWGVVSSHSVGVLRSNYTGTLTHDTPHLLNKTDTRDSMGQNFCPLTNKQDRIGGGGEGDLQKMTTSKNLMTVSHIKQERGRGEADLEETLSPINLSTGLHYLVS